MPAHKELTGRNICTNILMEGTEPWGIIKPYNGGNLIRTEGWTLMIKARLCKLQRLTHGELYCEAQTHPLISTITTIKSSQRSLNTFQTLNLCITNFCWQSSAWISWSHPDGGTEYPFQTENFIIAWFLFLKGTSWWKLLQVKLELGGLQGSWISID